jgi:transcriptional regulator with XRE-family HTH domain
VRLNRQVKPAGYPSVLNHLGDHLRKRRLDLGLQLNQAADALGCHATSVANWEAGRREPATRQLPRLIAFLGYDPRPDFETVGGRVRRHRTGLGFSFKAAAEQIGVDPGTLSRWERGRRQPEGKYLAKVYSFLGEDPRPAPATVAERLKRCREMLGWSQRDLARRIGVWPSTVERWELGQRKPGVEHMATLERLEDLVNERA